MFSASDLFSYQSHHFPGFGPDEHAQIQGLPVSSGRRLNKLKIVTVAEEPDDIPISDDETNDFDDMLSVDQKKARRLSAQYDMSYAPLTMSSSFSQGDFSLSMSPAASFLSAFSPSVDSPPQSLPDDEGQIVSGYTLGPIVGYGGFSTIRRASSPTGGTVAVKIVRRADVSKRDNPAQERRRLDHEAAVWSSLSHEHILPLFAAVHTTYADFFITLYCSSGSLFDILKRDGRPALPQDDTGMMFRQVVRGLRYLHEVAELVHRDIKLENVLLDETGVCRIGDFGMSRKIGELDEEEEHWEDEEQWERMQPHQGGRNVPAQQAKRAKTGLHAHLSLFRPSRQRHSLPTNSAAGATPPRAHIFQPGSLPYAAPELLLPQTSMTPVTPNPAQDIWALGVLLYTLLTGRLPFMDAFEPRLQMKILVGAYDVPQDIGRGAERVLQGCLERSAADRWTIAEVDEVAWGVGWGSEGDDVPIIVTDDKGDGRKQCRSSSRQTSPTRFPFDESTRNLQDEPRLPAGNICGPPADRARKTLARALAPSDISFSRSPSLNAFMSRRVTPQSSPSALRNAIFSEGSSSSPHVNPTLPPLDVPIIPTELVESIERGRRTQKHYESPSPSPSITPTTPVDVANDDRFTEPIHVVEVRLRSRPETSRGRTTISRDVGARHRARSNASSQSTLPKGGMECCSSSRHAEQDVSPGSRSERHSESCAEAIVAPASRRPGSTPPAPCTSKGDEEALVWRFSDPSGMRNRLARTTEGDSSSRSPRSQWRNRSS